MFLPQTHINWQFRVTRFASIVTSINMTNQHEMSGSQRTFSYQIFIFLCFFNIISCRMFLSLNNFLFFVRVFPKALIIQTSHKSSSATYLLNRVTPINFIIINVAAHSLRPNCQPFWIFFPTILYTLHHQTFNSLGPREFLCQRFPIFDSSCTTAWTPMQSDLSQNWSHRILLYFRGVHFMKDITHIF